MLRKLTIDIRIEAQAADDSALAPLVVEALQEFIAATNSNSRMAGKFESAGGLDVSWAAKNEYFDDDGAPMPRPISEAVAGAVAEIHHTPKGNGGNGGWFSRFRRSLH